MLQDELYLVLGCFGRIDRSNIGNFVSCGGIENRILHIDENLQYYDEMMDYFEGVRLFDKPLFDMNALRHFMYNMQNKFDQTIRKLWPERDFQLFERFLHSHKACGVYAKLILVDPEQEKPEIEEKPVLISGTPEKIVEPPNLRLVRNRR